MQTMQVNINGNLKNVLDMKVIVGTQLKNVLSVYVIANNKLNLSWSRNPGGVPIVQTVFNVEVE